MVIIKEAKTRVYPEEICIFDGSIDMGFNPLIVIKPEYYDVTLTFSPKMVLKMLRWLIREQYVVLKGTLYFRIHSKTGEHYVTTEKEKIKA
jgi:hypothetical protein